MKCRNCRHWKDERSCGKWPKQERYCEIQPAAVSRRDGMAVAVELGGYSPDCGIDAIDILVGPEFGCLGFEEGGK